MAETRMGVSSVVARQAAKPARRAPKTSQMERTVAAVLDATLVLLSEVGYRQLTIGLVSERSGVARSTIYRYWKNIPDLAIAAFDFALGPRAPAPDTGDVRRDLLTIYERFSAALKRSLWGRALPSLIEASRNEPAFAGLLPRLADQRREGSRRRLLKAIEQGELRPDADPEWILDTLTGLLYFRLLVSGTDLREPGMIDWAVDSVLSQVTTGKPASALAAD